MTHEEYHEYERFVQQFRSITSNLWYTWDPEAQKLVDVLLNKSNHELSSFQRFYEMPEEKKQELFMNTHLRASVDHVFRKLQDYLSGMTWFDNLVDSKPGYEIFRKNPVAFFCAEYGLTDWLNIYSGGLGVLAADLLKEASDLGLPMIGVGLLYQYGYFKQRFSESGYQTEEYFPMDPTKLPLTQIRISTGAPLLIEVTVIDHPVYCKIWTAQIGRVPLYLLDTNIAENVRYEDKLITGHLYGGDQDTRIRQEIILGIGGARAVSALGYHPTIYSMNEGHSAFAALEITKHFMHERGMSFDRAKDETRTKIIYTNHTLVPAGNDVFDYDIIHKYLNPYLIGLGIDFKQLYELGNPLKPDGTKASESFSMPDLAFELSFMANAVSKQHGEAAVKMWPKRNIIPITNGVHLPTWIHPKLQQLYSNNIAPDWQYSYEDEELWKNMAQIDPQELWNTRLLVKERVLEEINKEFNTFLAADALTIGWARRFAAYKHPDMVLEDLNRLSAILNNAQKPVQLIIAGKAHPKDLDGKNLMSRIYNLTKDEKYRNKLVFLSNYQLSLARKLVAGCDVWLNTPYPQAEASGTSGMKAAANGGLQLSVREGWVTEVNWEGKGFVFDNSESSAKLYELLEKEIIPMFYERNHQGIPERWVEYIKKSVEVICPMFSAKRTLQDYFNKLYTAALTQQH